MIWYVFDRAGLIGTVKAHGTVAASLAIGYKWGFHRVKNREVCWNIHPIENWKMWSS